MNTSEPSIVPTPALPLESATEKQQRIAHEAELLAQARAELDAGLGVEDDQLDAWLDQLERDSDTPLPTQRGIGAAPASRL